MSIQRNGKILKRVFGSALALSALGATSMAGAETITGVTQFGYDAAGRQICATVRMNPDVFASATTGACDLGTTGTDGEDRITFSEYDAFGRVTKVTSGYKSATPRVEKVATYTDNGRESTVADGKGNTTTYEYDGLDRLSKVRYPNTSGAGSSTSDYEQYGYDAAGNQTTLRKRSGETVTSVFDALNRITYRDGVKTWFYYDNMDRPTVTYAGASAEKISARYYDALGRVTADYAYLNGTFLPMSYWYDTAGRRLGMYWPDSFYVTYEYDNTGAMTMIREKGTTGLATYAYDNRGRRSAAWFANGANSQYNYDAASRLSDLSIYVPDAAKRQAYGLTYNAAGQVKSRSTVNGLYEWAGAAASKAYTTNGLNQYASVGGSAFSYDLRGNLTYGESVGYSYDLDNRLISTLAGASLVYDPLGRLQEIAKPSSPTERLVYDGSNLAAEYDTANTLLRRYVPGPGVDEPVVWYEGAGQSDRRYLQADPQGSIVTVTNATGALIGAAPNTYDEYGVPGAANQGRFQYTGQAWLPQVGLYHYKARAYSPTLGRFMQTDPIGYGDGLNWYAYVGNDPMNRSDPTGLAVADCGGIGQPACSVEEIKVLAQKKDQEKIERERERQRAEQIRRYLEEQQKKEKDKEDPRKMLGCGVKEDGTIGCGMMSYEYLCKSAQDRLKLLGYAATVPAGWAGYRNYKQMPTGQGGQKALGLLQVFMAVEAALNVGDMDVYCKKGN